MEDETTTMRNSSDERSSEVTDYLGALSRNIDIGSGYYPVGGIPPTVFGPLCFVDSVSSLHTARPHAPLSFASCLRNEIDTSIHTIDKLVKTHSLDTFPLPNRGRVAGE
jgi:hypothetical protein